MDIHPIAEFRLRKGLSQTDLAAAVGVSRESIRTWETCGVPLQPRHLFALAKVMRLQPLKLRKALLTFNQQAAIRARHRKRIEGMTAYNAKRRAGKNNKEQENGTNPANPTEH